ncbi:MAG TPA: glycoside hydrolase family 38 C-terminal domain-containing protein [Symbiobacteriaceae bacterium]|nr:glycoside hydrolase family 38 C-terminal domain-containing protein [Symbiobacteriaceae bacterium]
MKEITYTLTGHAHLDPVWQWDRQEGIEAVKATFRSALDRLQENPDLVFVHSSAAQYAFMEPHPALLAEIAQAVARKSWEPVGGFWVEPDMNIPSGEALARQGLHGQRYFQRVLGRCATVAFLPDSFGHPPTLPQIFKQCGLDCFLFWRPVGGEIDLPSNFFIWEGPDGTRIPAVRIETYNSNPNNVIDTVRASLAWRPPEAPEWIVLFGVGNHGGGPTKKAIASMRELAAAPDWPALRFGDIAGFFARATPTATYKGPLQYCFRGCYTSHSEVKKLNRRAEAALISAEKWSVIAQAYGLPYPKADLNRAWQHLLFNQFHDILAGTSIPRAYEDVRMELGEATGTARRAAYNALQKIAQRIDTRSGDHPIDEAMRRVRTGPGNAVADLGDGIPVVIFNPSPWRRREVVDVEINDWHIEQLQVQDDEGHPIIHQLTEAEAKPPRKQVTFLADLPPMGYRTYRIVDLPPAQLPPERPQLRATDRVLENRWWHLEVDHETGALLYLFDKERNRHLLNGPGAQLLVMRDFTDAWGGPATEFRDKAGAFNAMAVDLKENGPVRATIAIYLQWNRAYAVHEITLYRESPAIHGRLLINWEGMEQMAKLAFPFRIDQPRATFSVPFGYSERPANGEEEPHQQWLDVSGPDGGVSLINDCKYGADVLGAEARLSILRSPVYGHTHLDQGEQTLRWALVPHASPWQAAATVQEAAALNEPLTFVREYAHKGDLPKQHSFLTIDPPDACMLSALKQAEEGDDLIMRIYEHRGQHAAALIRLPLAQAAFWTEVGPHQIKTFRIGPAGAVREVNMLEE